MSALSLRVGILEAFSNVSRSVQCFSMLSSPDEIQQCHNKYFVEYSDPLNFVGALALVGANVTPVSIRDPRFSYDGELFTRLANGSVDVAFDYAMFTAERMEYFKMSNILSTVKWAVLRKVQPKPWYHMEFERLGGGMDNNILNAVLICIGILMVIHFCREFIFTHGERRNDMFSFWRQVIPSSSNDLPPSHNGVSRKSIVFSIGVLTFMVTFVLKSGLQQSLLISKPPDSALFIRDLIDDLAAKRTKIAFDVEGHAAERMMRSMDTPLTKLLVGAMDDNPPIYNIPFDSMKNEENPVAIVSNLPRLYSYLIRMPPDECVKYNMNVWPDLPFSLIGLALSKTLTNKKTEMLNVAIAHRFQMMDRFLNFPRAVSETCRQHFFPSTNDMQLSFKPLSWYTVNGLVFGLVGIGGVAAIILVVEIIFHERFDVDYSPIDRRKFHHFTFTTTSVEEETRLLFAISEIERVFGNGDDIRSETREFSLVSKS